jgi:hypothetical protein
MIEGTPYINAELFCERLYYGASLSSGGELR